MGHRDRAEHSIDPLSIYLLDITDLVGQPAFVKASGNSEPLDPAAEPTYSLGAVARLTGLSSHVLRAWERRYGAVKPLRTPGGTRRYREADVARLRRLRAAVQAGHPISEVANVSDEELDHRLRLAPALPAISLDPVLEAIDGLDAETTRRLLGAQLAALGPARFARSVASPLLNAVGSQWEAGQMCIASEHLAASTLRSLLGSALHITSAALQTAPVMFTTLPGDAHDLGSLMAAVTTAAAGGHPFFVGGDLPVSEIVDAAETIGAAAVAVGICPVGGPEQAQSLAALRDALPAHVEVWVGGRGANAISLPARVARIADPDALESKIALLVERGGSS